MTISRLVEFSLTWIVLIAPIDYLAISLAADDAPSSGAYFGNLENPKSCVIFSNVLPKIPLYENTVSQALSVTCSKHLNRVPGPFHDPWGIHFENRGDAFGEYALAFRLFGLPSPGGKGGAFLTRNTLAWLIPILMFTGLFYILRNVKVELPRTSDFLTIGNLKIVFALFCLLFTVYFIVGVLPVPVDWPRNLPVPSLHSRAAVTDSLLSALFFGAALYGIHKRTVTAWRLGWVYLGGGYISLIRSLTRTVPEGGSPRIFLAVAVTGASLVFLYWGFWWKKQRGYFKDNT